MNKTCMTCRHHTARGNRGNCRPCAMTNMSLWEPKEGEVKVGKNCSNCGREVMGKCDVPIKSCTAGNGYEKWIPIKEHKGPIGQGPFKTQVGGDHYQKKFPFCQPSEFFARNQIPFIEANICKYALRHELKNGIEDLRKAKHYLEMIAHCQYGEEL